MNLLQLILIFLAIIICAAVAYIAWELTSDAAAGKHTGEDSATRDPDDREPPAQQ